MARFLGIPQNLTNNLDLSTYTLINSACFGTIGATILSATNASFAAGQRIYIAQMRGTSVGKVEDNQIVSYVAGTITLAHPLENTYSSTGDSKAQVVVVPEAGTSSGVINVPAWDGTVGGLFVMAVINAGGNINVSEKGYRGGAGGLLAGNQGEGTAGPGGADADPNGTGGGSGTNFQNTTPSGGGHVTAGQSGIGSTGGDAVGDVTLADIYMGGAGGGASASGGPGIVGGTGGRSGGIAVVYAYRLLSTLVITSNGQNGLLSANGEFGGAGGSAGSILAKCVENLGATLTAIKGTGANGSIGDGKDGADGRIRIETCLNTVGSENPTASLSEGGHNYCASILQMI